MRRAQELIRARHGADDVRLKAPGDIVTGTDLAAQSAMQLELQLAFADVDFVGEEGESSRSTASRYWLADPLCGTSNYAAGLPLYSVNLALVENGQVSVGVVGDGVTGEVYVAERGQGAWLDGGGTLHVSDRTRVVSVEPMLAQPGPARDLAMQVAQRVIASPHWTPRILGTMLALPYVAAGHIAGAIYAAGASPVHRAAGLLLAEEAGARITDAQGHPWQLDSPVVVVAASPELHAQLLVVATS